MLLGSLNKDDKNVTVIGAGIAGLIATYRLLNAGYRVILYEKESRAGGLIKTIQTDYGPVETAVHSIPGTKPVRQLFEDLNISISETIPKAKGLIFRDGAITTWPLKRKETLYLFWQALTKKADNIPKSLSDWARHHMGCLPLDILITPMTIGIYGTTPDQLEMPTAFPTMKVEKGKTLFSHLFSRRKNKRPPPIAARQGMQKLTDQLLAFIDNHPNGIVHFNTPIKELPDAHGNIVLCTPAITAAEILQSRYSELPAMLENIQYSPLITATVFVDRNDVPELKTAFGVLFPPKDENGDQHHILGILFNSICYENRINSARQYSLTFMLGGTVHPELLNQNDEFIKQIIQGGLKKYLGWQNRLSNKFFDCTITRWPRAVPIYNHAIRELCTHFSKNSKPGLLLFGNYTGDVSLRGMIETDFFQ